MTRKSLPPPANPGPKPSLLDELERSKIVAAIEGGAGKVMSCHVNQVDYRRFLRTMHEDHGFRRVVAAAHQMKREIAMAVIYEGVSQHKSEVSAATYVNLDLKIEAMTRASVEARALRKIEEEKLRIAEAQLKPVRLDALSAADLDALHEILARATDPGEALTDADADRPATGDPQA